MWLFDDLLKKPTDASSTTATGTQSTGSTWGTQSTDPIGGVQPPIIADPLMQITQTPNIKKTDEVSIVTESPLDTAAREPDPVHVLAVDDPSSILIGTSVVEEDNRITQNPLESKDSPIVDIHANDLKEDVPKDALATKSEWINTSEVVDLGNLFGDSKSEEVHAETPPSADTIEESILIVTSPIIETMSTVMSESPQTVEAYTPMSAIHSPEVTDILTENTQEELVSRREAHDTTEALSSTYREEAYEHPSDFIAASIAHIDAMIEKIDSAYNTKLEEALGYKAEKEKYTTLEEQAYADAEKYTEEKEHALTMRSYFVGQWEIGRGKSEENTSESVASVETTLTELAVQNAVTETVALSKKTKNKKQEEESVWMLGL